MASAAARPSSIATGIPERPPLRNALMEICGHGGVHHKLNMWQGFQKLRSLSIRVSHIRMNQVLVDPIKGVVLSRLKADVQGLKPPNIMYVVESVVTHSDPHKWNQEISKLWELGYVLRPPIHN